MKKLLAIFLCLLMCIVFSGCNNTEKKNDEAKAAFQEVLENKRLFSYKCLVFDKITEENLEKFNFKTEYSALNSFIPQMYAYLDFDQDGVEELLIVDAMLSYFLVLRYDGEKVIGYISDDNVDLQNVKTDGTFLTVSYIFDDNHKIIGKNYFVCGFEFDGLDHKMKMLVSQNDEEGVYKIGKQSATKDEVEAHINNWKNSTTQIEWNKINLE